MKQDHLLRAAALVSILMAGSCSVANDGNTISEDGARNHPIAVEPSYRELKIQFAGNDGISRDDAVRFDDFVADYRLHGNGSLGISVPDTPSSRAAITFFGERAASQGISRDKILISTHAVANGDYRVDLNYIAYTARAEACGDWSENEAFTGDNLTPKNFGCSVQHNIAAMVADPRDLLGPTRKGDGDTARRQTVLDLYEKGQPSQATKHSIDMGSEQSAPGSGVSNQ